MNTHIFSSKKIQFLALFALAAGILSIGITKNWRLLHEENAAVVCSFARSHIVLGLGQTRCHNIYYAPQSKKKLMYSHHPPGMGLSLAAGFQLLQSDAPWAARTVAILFHLGSLALMVWLLSQFFPFRMALFGGFLMAILPMTAYFGQMVNFEAGGFFFVMLQLSSYTYLKIKKDPRAAWVLFLAILGGGLMDWMPFFFSLGIFIAEFFHWVRTKEGGKYLFIIGAAGWFIFLFNILHSHWAAGESWEGLKGWLAHVHKQETKELRYGKIILTQLEYFRRYFTHVGLLATFLLFLSFVLPKKNWARKILNVSHLDVFKSVMWVVFAGTLVYCTLMMSWATSHHYLSYYLVPFVIAGLVLVFQFLMELKKQKPRLGLILLVVFFIDILGVSLYTLRLRHTREGGYSMRKTADLQASFIPPGSVFKNN